MNRGEYRELVNVAYKFLQLGLQAGRIKSQPCVVCHKSKTEGHHTDYRHPELLVWLCGTHHRNAHKGVLQFLGEATVYRTVDCFGNPVPRTL
jgi:hypothetical protein